MAKIRLEDIQIELEKDGWSTASDVYVNLDTEMEFICDEGHHIYLPWKKIRNKRECPVCKQNKFKNQKIEAIPKKKNSYRILALDQATKVSGWSIYDDKKLIKYGTFEADLSKEEIERDCEIKHWLLSMIENWQPDYVGIEGLQFEQHFGVTVFETLARLQGIVMLTLHEANLPYKVCPTNTWRAHCKVKGRSRSDKKASMISLVKEWFDVTVTDDCADAIGIGKYISETVSPKVEIFSWE